MRTMRYPECGTRGARISDRPCSECGEPMIGIMRVSNPPIRTACSDCGGRSVYDKRKPEAVR